MTSDWMETRVGASSIARDISEIKRMQERSSKNEKRARAVIDAARDAYVAIDPSSVISEWNPMAEKIFGWSRDEVLGRKVTETIIPERYREAHEHGVARYLQTGQGPVLESTVELSARRRDGEEFPVELSIWPLELQSELTFHAFVRDISERKRQQEALEEQAELLGLVQDAVIARTLDGTITYWNRTAEEYYGWAADEALGEVSHHLLRTEFPEPRDEVIQTVLRDGRWEGELAHVRRNGTKIVVASRWALRRDDRGEAFEFLEVNNDITARKQAEGALVVARDEAERANRAKSEFLSRMSHELRTPLNAILGFGQVLEMDDLRPEQRDDVKEIIRGGKHLLEVINEILDISRIETGRFALSLEPVPLLQLVDDTVALVRPLANKRGITISIDRGEEQGLHVHADQQRLKQVFLNLLSNAVKYNRDAGQVAVSITQHEDSVGVAIADTGAGIPRDKMHRLFSPFDRLGAEQTEVEGTGLGLAISKRLVEVMGGSISVESSPGEGSVFAVELAPAQGDDAGGEETTAGSEWEHGAGGRVLYIEDNLSNLALVRRLIARRRGIELLTATTGTKGIDIAVQERPDVVLLDLHLPDLDGSELLAHLQNDPRTAAIPVVVVSADATPGQISRLREAGAAGYLTKPIDVRAFMDTLDPLLGNDAVGGAQERSA